MTLAGITDRLRKRLIEYRHANRFEPRINSAMNRIEIALNLAELAIAENRAVTVEEELWFNESWTIIQPLEHSEWKDMIDLYRTMKFKLNERNWLRT